MKKSQKVYLSIFIGVVVFNLIAWFSKGFCDWYISHITPIWVNTYGRLMNLFPFSVGEIMIIIGILFVCYLLVISIIFLCKKTLYRILFHNKRKDSVSVRTLETCSTVKSKHTVMWYSYVSCAWIILGIIVIMSLNYTVLYHGTSFYDRYIGGTERDYSLDELKTLRNYLVDKCNELSTQMERDENGDVVYDKDITKEAKKAIGALGNEYEQLRGYCPNPKPLLFSDLLCQQYMQGYFFPFSMEANYNDVMYIMNKPSTMCHELAHMKGFINEDEANFIGFLACINSDDLFLQYSGYLSVLYYVDNDFYDDIGKNDSVYELEPAISEQVIIDNVFVKAKDWKRINEKALVDTEVIASISDQFTETYLKLNGVSDGMISYSRVVKLLLQYYYSFPSQQ